MIKTIIFDLDRTLLNLDISEFKSLNMLYDNNFKMSSNFEDFFKIYRKHNDIWWFKKSRYEANEKEVKQNRFRDTILELDIKTDLSLQEISDLYFEQAKSYWQFYDGALESLTSFSKSYTIGMITNGFTKTQNQKIDALNIREYFNYICLSEQTGFSKPDKRIFDHTLTELASDAHESIYIGDDYDSDVLGSKNAGLTPVWFNPEKKENPNGVLEFAHFSELETIIQSI